MQEMKKENKMGVMPVPQLVLSMSLPIMVSMLVQSLYNIVDGIFVARISEEALTATSIAYSAQILQIAVAVGTGVGVNALVSRRLGAKDYDGVNQAATTGLWLTLISSLVFVLWGILGTEIFIRQFSQNERIVDLGTKYLRICQIFSTGIFLGTLTQRLLQATGRTFSSMMAQMAGAVVNIVLDPVLIFGYWGFPEMGISGAAIATVIGQWAAALIGIWLNCAQNKEIRFIFGGYRMKKEDVLLIYKVGAPTILTQAFGSIMVAGMNVILNLFSETSVAFFGVYYKLQNFLFMPMNGLGQGALPIVGFNFGAGKKERIQAVCKVAIGVGAAIGLAGTFVFMLIPRTLLQIFSAGEGMLLIGVPALRIISVSFVFTAVTMICGYIVSGLGNGMVNMMATAIRQLIVLLPLVLLLGKLGGNTAIWYAFWISEICAFAFAALSLKKALQRASGGSAPHAA